MRFEESDVCFRKWLKRFEINSITHGVGCVFVAFALLLFALLFHVGSARAQTLNEWEVLKIFYSSTGGDNWSNSQNWNGGNIDQTTDLSLLYGVEQLSLAPEKRITFLNFSDNGLSGEIPTELKELTSLQRLWLNGNRLSGNIPGELGQLTSLQHLYLHRNQLSGKIPTELKKLTSLQHLILHRNQLSGEIPEELGALTGLQYLFLHGNRLSGEIPTQLVELTSLYELYLNDNQLSGEIPLMKLETLATTHGLQELGLWGNGGLTGEESISDELGKRVDRAVLRSLHSRNGGSRWNNDGGWLSRGDLFSFDDWYGVDVNNNGRVSALNLRSNGLEGEITNALEALGGLKSLDISGNRELTGTLPLRLMDLPVTTLDIRCTGVSTPGDTDFQDWLRGIDFRQGCPPPPPSPPSPPSPPGQVMGLMVIEGELQLSVSWNPVSEADGYKVQWKSDSQEFDSSREHIITSGDTVSYTISNLVAGVEYIVRVIAIRSGADDGVPSSRVRGVPETLEPEEPPESPELPQSDGGGGCTIASDGLNGNASRSGLLNLLLVVSAPFLAVSRKRR